MYSIRFHCGTSGFRVSAHACLRSCYGSPLRDEINPKQLTNMLHSPTRTLVRVAPYSMFLQCRPSFRFLSLSSNRASTGEETLVEVYRSPEVSRMQGLRTTSIAAASLFLGLSPTMFYLSSSTVTLPVRLPTALFVATLGVGSVYATHFFMRPFVYALHRVSGSRNLQFTTFSVWNKEEKTRVCVDDLECIQTPLFLLSDPVSGRKFAIPEEDVIKLIEKGALPKKLSPDLGSEDSPEDDKFTL